MPAQFVGVGRMWRWQLDSQVGKTERVIIEEQRVSPCCPNGVTERLAFREYRAPYRWVPIGFRCSQCGGLWVTGRGN